MSRPSLADKILLKYFRDELDRILIHSNQKITPSTNRFRATAARRPSLNVAISLRLIFAELWQLGYKLKSPTALKPKHLHALCAHWQEKRLCHQTIHGLFSNIRAFCRWVDKGILEDISVYFQWSRHLVRRQPPEDLSWEAK